MRAKGEQVTVLACRPGPRCRQRAARGARTCPRPAAVIHKRQSTAARQPVVRLRSAGEAAFWRRRARPGPSLVCTGCVTRRATG